MMKMEWNTTNGAEADAYCARRRRVLFGTMKG
jgi:hypothetical protein